MIDVIVDMVIVMNIQTTSIVNDLDMISNLVITIACVCYLLPIAYYLWPVVLLGHPLNN